MKNRVLFVDDTSGEEEPLENTYIISVPRVGDYISLNTPVIAERKMYKVTKVIQELYKNNVELEHFEVHLIQEVTE